MKLSMRHHLLLAGGLRVISAGALVVLAAAFFYQPLRLVLGPRIQSAAYRLGVSGLLGSPAAPGFMLQVTTRPPGAAVLIDGVPRGTTPAILNVVCSEGQEVLLAIRKEGYREFRQSVPCRAGQTARARIDLTRPSASPG